MHADYFQIATVLAFIVGLILFMAWFARRFTTGRAHEANAISVLATRFLGPKEKLLLVEVEGTRVLIGINGQNMISLCKVESKSGDFSSVLDQAQAPASAPAKAVSGEVA